MDPIFDFSAAPHIPLSLREPAGTRLRPELVLSALSGASSHSGKVIVLEHNGELYIEFGLAA